MLREFGCFGKQIEDFNEEARITFAASRSLHFNYHVRRFLLKSHVKFLKNHLILLNIIAT